MVTGPRTHEWEITKLRTELAIQTKRAEEAEAKLAREEELRTEELQAACDRIQMHQKQIAALNAAERDLATLLEQNWRMRDIIGRIARHEVDGSEAIHAGVFLAQEKHLAAVASKETSGQEHCVPAATDRHAPPREPQEGGPAREKWYSSGRGIFKQDAGSQVACAAATVNWQEDTAMMVRLLNAGEGADATLAEVRKVVAEMREWNVVADVQSWADRLDAAIGGGK